MSEDDLNLELVRFLQDHPDGWSHDDWLRLLFQLSEHGYDTADEDRIGLALERQRLTRALADKKLGGLGPRRIEAVAEHFKTLWNLRDASLDEVARVPGVPKALARSIVESFRAP